MAGTTAQRDATTGATGPLGDDGFWSQPEDWRGELIDGTLYAMTPPGVQHQRLSRELVFCLAGHVHETGGPCEVLSAPLAVRVTDDDRNWFEPDIVVVCNAAKLSERGCEGAPDLVIEIVSPSTQRRDYIVKTARYEEGGVREYWIVDPIVRQTTVWRFDAENVAPSVYPFSEPVPVGIWGDALRVTMASLLA